jgi:hypothetical protein
MEENIAFSSLMKMFVLITSPVTFLVGLFLLYDIDTYLKIEKFLARSFKVSRKQWVGWLEKNRETLQIFLIRRRRLLGVICLLNAVGVIVANLAHFKKC